MTTDEIVKGAECQKYKVTYRYTDGATGQIIVIATSYSNAEHFVLDGKDGVEMKREAALAVVHDGVYYDTLTDEAARAIANIVLNS